MNLADKITLFRIILAPVFLVVFFLPKSFSLWVVPVLMIIFTLSEITDYFDGLAARKLNLSSDFGKLFDPFADTLVQSTYFLCFLVDGIWGNGILPVILFMLFMYREFGILFLRNMMLKKGTALGARMGGKIKTVGYIVSGSLAVLVTAFERTAPLLAHKIAALSDFHNRFLPVLKTTALVVFSISVAAAVISFIDYLLIYQKTNTEKNNND